MEVLVYGEWPNQTQNIKPFFTASYHENEKEDIYIRNYRQKLKFCFVGSLSKGKRPQLALRLIHRLQQYNVDVEFNIYGNGKLRPKLDQWINQHQAENWVKLHGNQPKAVIKKALKYSHFMILPSQSEGWPKAVAEAMFWGCIPIVPRISCVPWMLAEGQRGILMHPHDIKKDINQLQSLIQQPEKLEQISKSAAEWSQQYTLDRFEKEITYLI
ncbi:MAG: glycosyltransferase [Bacteroidetes bacterium]|jgi:glycosyltransferase involved in cell wall biosynthesis|nr:glycosyltransferase [Bacteroidota bacterium]